jgi:hypothetical protein
MTSYAGLKVSQQETHVCVVDASGALSSRNVANLSGNYRLRTLRATG